MKITLIGPNGVEMMHAHATGCRDIGQPRYRACEKQIFECASVQEVVEEFYCDFLCEGGGSDLWESWENFLCEIRFFPCCSGLPRTSEPAAS